MVNELLFVLSLKDLEFKKWRKEKPRAKEYEKESGGEKKGKEVSYLAAL